MKYGRREFGAASLELCLPKALPQHMRKNVIELRALYTEPQYRGNGFATDLLHDVCLEADLARKFLFLCVSPGEDGPLGLEKLANWYHKFGFTTIQASPLLMTRPFVGALMGMAA